jgi:hypothetical protein
VPLHLRHLHPVPGADPLARERSAEAEWVQVQGGHGGIVSARVPARGQRLVRRYLYD